jgi:oligopeptidase A
VRWDKLSSMPNASAENPLLDLTFDVPFDRIGAHHVVPGIEALLADARLRLDALVNLEAARTFENTMEGMEAVTERLSVAMGVVGHIEGVATTPALREAYSAVQPIVSAFYTGLTLNARLYAAVKSYAASDEAKTLSPTRKRFVDKTLADFRRQGAELDRAGKSRLEALDVELTNLTVKYSQNVLDATNAFELTITSDEELAGLPEGVRAAARASALSKGQPGYRFTLQAPSYIPLVTYAENASVRERAWRAHNTRATGNGFDNRPIIARILELRHEKARLLGFADFADLVLDDRMAKSGKSAMAFIERLREQTEPFFLAENRLLEAFRRDCEGRSAPALKPWDVSYYSEKQRASLYDFDDEALRPYFAAENVLGGLFRIAKSLYGVDISPWNGVAVWDVAVRPYKVLDRDGVWLGSFYVDLYPRESKRDGAWMDGLITGVWQEARKLRHLEVLAANVAPPLDGKPALLNHREVETMFHEFGHLMHHVLSKVEVRSLGGTNVAWDFVELPSMIMENWAWDKSILQSFARHYETGELIPDDLLEKMRRAKNYRAANAMMRQLGFSATDLALHTEFVAMPRKKEHEENVSGMMHYARDIMARYSPIALPENYAMIAGFSHLFSSPVGYAAGYYSYKWAEVLDADAFTRFQAEGLLNEGAGAHFREAILSKGDSRDPRELYRAFMGREPDEAALLRRSGLIAGQLGP